ncbi:MAG: hypothetical protein AAF363_00915 [Bacteroidota bacterium]
MKKVCFLIFSYTLLIMGCSDGGSGEFTGQELTFPMVAGPDQNISGQVTLRETSNGFTNIEVSLTGTIAGFTHPVHLHDGNIEKVDAAVLALLESLNGSSGESNSTLQFLADETEIKFEDLANGDFHIKVHQAAVGAEKDIILAAGNIGSAFEGQLSTENSTITVCQSK